MTWRPIIYVQIVVVFERLNTLECTHNDLWILQLDMDHTDWTLAIYWPISDDVVQG